MFLGEGWGEWWVWVFELLRLVSASSDAKEGLASWLFCNDWFEFGLIILIEGFSLVFSASEIFTNHFPLHLLVLYPMLLHFLHCIFVRILALQIFSGSMKWQYALMTLLRESVIIYWVNTESLKDTSFSSMFLVGTT